ncbi:MAG TPA: PIG-L deacetylase family protein [Gemmatimonadales bacterium]|nr:PIG-L deacetylase family protein [Gemmatimonadales bacterium]
MHQSDLTRRGFVGQSLAAVAGATALPLAGAERDSGAAPLAVLCVGGHPDDPESGCGGTLARYAALGHAVTILYLTRGERGIEGKSLDEAARIRSAECLAACKILGATAAFFGQIDGATELNHPQVDAMHRFFATAKPDIIFTHWPVDTHMDHQVASILTIRAWMNLPTARLYFFEVNAGSQTQGFLPNTYVDISSVVEQKKTALFAHVSQDGRGIWREHHEVMAAWRGREAGVAAAEAFVHLDRNDHTSPLPGV